MDWKEIFAEWNPWHGCKKISEGCKHCYVYRQDESYGTEISSSEVRKTANFDLPVKRRRDGSYKMRERHDLMFFFFTKRITRFAECMPKDWGEGYENVIIGCTVENQAMADVRLPVFMSLPIRHRAIIVAPILERVDLSPWLDGRIEEVSVGGESGVLARVCDYEWILDLRRQCLEKDVPFRFHQTGAKLLKDGKLYRIRRPFQITQARKAGIDFRIGEDFKPVL